MRKTLISLTFMGLGALAPAMSLAASTSEYTYGDYANDYTYTDDLGTTAATDSGATAALGVGFLIFSLIAGLVGLAGFVFWLVMFIDVIKRDFDQKVLWIVLMLFFGFLASVFYYFMIKKKNVTGTTKKPIAPSTTVAPTATDATK